MSARGIHSRDLAEQTAARITDGDQADAPDDQAPEGDEDPRVEAARVTLGALKDDDAESFADALGALVDLHGASPPAEAKPALKVSIARMAAKGGT